MHPLLVPPNKNDKDQYAVWEGVWSKNPKTGIWDVLTPTLKEYVDVIFFHDLNIPEAYRAQLKKLNHPPRIVKKFAAPLQALLDGAAKQNIYLHLESGFRTMSEQVYLRLQNVLDKRLVKSVNMNLMPVDDRAEEIIMTGDSSLFSPVTGKPGLSNHQNGRADDFSTQGYWNHWVFLAKHAFEFGFVRTVKSERWHHEYLPLEKNKFHYVEQSHPTWDKLV